MLGGNEGLNLNYLLYVARHPLVKKTVLGLGGAIIVLILTYVEYWSPVYKVSHNLSQDIKSYDKEIKSVLYQKKMTYLYDRAISRINHVEAKINANNNQSTILQELHHIFRKWNIKVLNLSYEEGKPFNGYTPLYQNVTFKCTYPDLRKFLLELNKLTFLIIEEEMHVKKISNSNGEVKVSLRLVIYRKKNNEKENIIVTSRPLK